MQHLQIKKTLVPIDFSDNSMNVLEIVIFIAKRPIAAMKFIFAGDKDNRFYVYPHACIAHDAVKMLDTLV